MTDENKNNITIDLDKNCTQCGEPGVTESGLCLKCVGIAAMDSIPDIRRQVQERVQKEAEQQPPKEEKQEIDSAFIGKCLFSNSSGDGLLYATLFRDKFLYVKNIQEWFEWTGHRWQRDKMNRSMAAVEKVAEVYLEEYKKISGQIVEKTKAGESESEIEKLSKKQKAILERVRQLRGDNRRTACLKFAHTIDKPLAITGDEFDQKPTLFPFANGVLDMETGKFKEGRPGDYLSLGSPVEWKGIDEPCPLWEKTLREIYNCDREGDDQSLIKFMQRLLGYAASGKVSEKVFPVFYGKTGWNGRSLLIERVKYVMGDLAAPIPSELLLSQRFAKSSSGPSPDIMILKGKRMVFASEIDEGQRFSIAKIKWITGKNELTARNPNDKYFTNFDPTHTVFVETNIQPSAPADDKSFWERLLLIPHNISFVNRDPRESHERRANLNLDKELEKENSGIAAWLERGFLMWQRDGLNPPAVVTEATAKYRMDEDMLGDWIEECCVRDPLAKEKAADLFHSFVEWYHTNQGKGDKLTGTWFGKQLGKKFEKTKSNGCNVYIGISLKKGGLETINV
ncbi:MAG: phage/plasmid primase, P4 family [Patescibacteria group bacterium]